MSWRDRAAKAREAPEQEPTKPTKGGQGAFVSNVSSSPGPFLREEARAVLPAFADMGAALVRVDADRAPEPSPSPLSGVECGGCDNLEMREEGHTGTRRRFWWRCKKAFELQEVRRYGERVTVAPLECEEAGAFRPWKAGTK